MRRWFFRIMAHLVAPNKQEKKLFSILLIVGLVFFVTTKTVWAIGSSETDSEGWMDSVLGFLAGTIIVPLAMVVGQIAVFLIGVLTIPFLQYNGFVTSSAVGMGWAVVRDAVNMFYVIILILIAFGTILGLDRFKWREQIPRLLGTAIVINFSRTLCGIMIDFSQIMTLTFVNAIKDIAGGNFVKLFGITSILEANGDAEVLFGANGEGITAFGIFAASIVALMMMLIILITILFLTIIFAYRIVLLWALIIIAPLAWFFKGAKGVVDPESNPYGTWWKRFKCALTIGPILTFFLWLALAIAGSGDIGADFPTSNASEGEGLDVGIFLQAMNPSHMVGFIVGIALIFVGFDAASDACGSEANIKGLLGMAKSWVKPVATAPIAVSGLAAKYGWAGARGLQKGIYNQTIGRGATKARNWAGEAMGTVAGHKLTPATLSHFLSKQSAKIKAKEAAEAEATIKERPLDTQSLVTRLRKGPSAFDVNNQEYNAELKEALNRDDVIDALGADGLKEILTKPRGKKTAEGRMLETFAADPSVQKQIKALRKKMPTAFGAVDDIKEADDIKGLSGSQLAEASVRERIGQMTKDSPDAYTYIGKDGQMETMDMVEAIMKGHLGRPVKDAWIKGENIAKDQRSPAVLAQKVGKDLSKVTKSDIGAIDEAKISEASVPMAKLLSEGSEDQAKWVGEKLKLGDLNSDDATKKTAAQEKLRGLMAAALRQSDAKKRAKFRRGLEANGVGLSQAFDLTKDNAGRLVFQDQAAKNDFAAAIAEDPTLLVKALKQAQEERASSEELEQFVNPGTVKKLLAVFKTSDGPKKDQAKAGLEEVFAKLFQGKDDLTVKQEIAAEDKFEITPDGSLVNVGASNEGKQKYDLLKVRRQFNKAVGKNRSAAAVSSTPIGSISSSEIEKLGQRISNLQNQLNARSQVLTDSDNNTFESFETRDQAKAKVIELINELKQAKKEERRRQKEEVASLSGRDIFRT